MHRVFIGNLKLKMSTELVICTNNKCSTTILKNKNNKVINTKGYYLNLGGIGIGYHTLGCIIYNTKYTKYTSVNPQSTIQEQYL